MHKFLRASERLKHEIPGHKYHHFYLFVYPFKLGYYLHIIWIREEVSRSFSYQGYKNDELGFMLIAKTNEHIAQFSKQACYRLQEVQL